MQTVEDWTCKLLQGNKRMIKQRIFFILLFLIPVVTYAEWTKIGKTSEGDTFYIDFKTIKKNNGYVYYWKMTDYLKPSKFGDMSSKMYEQAECSYPRYKFLSGIFYNESMGKGTGDSSIPKDQNWIYPPPESIGVEVIKTVCDYAK